MYERQRTHPFGIVDSFVKNIRMAVNALLPAVIVLIGTETGRRYLLPAAGAILLLYIAYSIAWWYRYVYYIAEDELRLEYGLIARKKRYIPLERIQNVQFSENVLQRLLGLVGVKVETAGSSVKAEADLYSVRRAQAEELRRLLQGGRSRENAAEAAEQTPAWPEYRLSGRALLLTAVSSSRVVIIFSGMAALLSQVDQFFPQRDVYGLVDEYMNIVMDTSGMLLLLLLIAVLFVAWLLACGSEILQWANFRLIVKEDRFLIKRGLLTRRQVTLPRRRIQAVQLEENLVHKPLGLLRVKVVTAGGSAGNEVTSILYPVLRKSELASFLQTTVPELAEGDLTVTPVPRRAAPRYFAVLLLPLALILTALSLIVIDGWWFALPAAPFGVWLAYRQFRDAGWQLTDRRLVLRRRRVALVTTLLVRRRIQSLDCSQSFLQKRRELANLKAAVASGSGGARIKLAGIPTADGEILQEWYRG